MPPSSHYVMNHAIRLTFRLVLVGLCFLVLIACGGSEPATDAEQAGEYPTRPITIVAWVNPGSPTDLLARTIAQVGEKHFGQRIRVLNRPGGGGAMAMSFLLSQPRDGHTLVIMTNSGVVNMALGHIPYEPDDFRFIARIQIDPYLIAVRDESPFEDLQAFFQHAHENPGDLSIAGFGVASGHFLAFAELNSVAGEPDVRWIAYEGSSDAAVAMLGGHVDAVNVNYNTIREHLRTGSVRVLGVSSPLSSLPEVPTYQDQGFDIRPAQWRGVMGPAGMPAELVDRIRELLEETVQDEEFRAFMTVAAIEYGMTEGPDALQGAVVEEVRQARAMLRGLGLVVGERRDR